MGPMYGYQDYRRTRPSVEPETVGRLMMGPAGGMAPERAPDREPDMDTDDAMMAAAPMTSHSPESTAAALREAVGRSLARGQQRGPGGAFSIRQLRQMGVPDSEIMINRASGLVEGDD